MSWLLKRIVFQLKSLETSIVQMDRLNFTSAIVLLILLLLRCARGLDTATVSITSAVEYSIEPACVQSCVFWNNFGFPTYLVSELGCTRLAYLTLLVVFDWILNSTIYNACYCTQLADQKASTILSSCVKSLCSGATEVGRTLLALTCLMFADV